MKIQTMLGQGVRSSFVIQETALRRKNVLPCHTFIVGIVPRVALESVESN